ncbi:hypothetical protein D3C72_996780 [compost metagenome]
MQYAINRAATVAGAVHPRTATLVGAGIEIEEEAADVLTVFLDFEQAHVRMPGVETFLFSDFDAV